MRRYWWVNHNTTFEHEIAGEYLWSPQREARARSTSYDNMRRVSPGDFVVSYAAQQNRHIGQVSDYALAAPKPAEFGSKGAYWADLGWYVPIAWKPLPYPVRHRDFWDELWPLLPDKFSPVVKATMRGNQKLYLAEVSEAVFNTVFKRSGLKEDFLTQNPAPRAAEEVIDALEAASEGALLADASIDDTVRAQVVAARRGQGEFRRKVREIRASCWVTGLEHDTLLVASHIKPWRACETAHERLDGNNGLLLAPQIDRLFDRGFISFEDSGEVLVSGHISDQVLIALGCPNLRSLTIGPLSTAHHPYLAYHREHEFLRT